MSESIEDIKKELANEKKKVSVLEQKLRLYELPSPARSYYVGKKLLNKQVDFLDSFDFGTEIKKNPKDDKLYDRAIDVFEKLSANSVKIHNLESELGLTGDEKKDTIKKGSFLDNALS
jgi:hypothetical protein